MEWNTLSCPNRQCQFSGIAFAQSRLVRNGSSHGHKQAVCRACGQSVGIRRGTASWDVNADPALFDLTVRALAERNSLRSTGRSVQIDC